MRDYTRAPSPSSPRIACAEGLISLNSAPSKRARTEGDFTPACFDGEGRPAKGIRSEDPRSAPLTTLPAAKKAEKEKRARNMMPPPRKPTKSEAHGAMELVLDSPRVAERHRHWRAELRTELLTASLAYALR